MSEHTAISWCDSTFNPWMGCTKVSPACDHCYAERLMDHRMHKVKWGAGQPRVRTSAANWRQPMEWERAGWRFVQCDDCGRRGPAIVSNGATRCGSCDSQATTPARRRVFCASLADVFDNEVEPAWREDLFRLIEATPTLDWLLLTKRIGAAAQMMFLARGGHLPLLPNVWLGATVVTQEEADRDIPKLLATPAAVRFLSIEPMLGPVDLVLRGDRFHRRGDIDPLRGERTTYIGAAEDGRAMWAGSPCERIDWVICGGESGPHARPMHPDWVRSLRDQCAAASVPFHFKQWGEWLAADGPRVGSALGDAPRGDRSKWRWLDRDGSLHERTSSTNHARSVYGSYLVANVGTKPAGRLLDGIEHNGFPSCA